MRKGERPHASVPPTRLHAGRGIRVRPESGCGEVDGVALSFGEDGLRRVARPHVAAVLAMTRRS